MIFKLIIDGVECMPLDWASTEIIGSWDDDFFAITGSLSLNFEGDEYHYLRGIYETAYCSSLPTKLYIENILIHEGLMFLSEAEWDLIKCIVNVAISDNGYLATILNKGKQVYFLDAGTDSSNNPITPASSTSIDFHIVSTGASDGNRTCYTVFEAFDYLVRAMTDDGFGFVSDFFSTGNGSGYVLTTGLEIRTPVAYGGNPAPALSWDTLWEACRKLFNLRGFIDSSGNLRVEPFDYFRLPGILFTANGITQLTEFIDTESLYSTIDAGASTFQRFSETTPPTSYPDLALITWAEQTYTVVGGCVTDNTLDLEVREIYIDSNAIEACLLGDEEYDEEIFIIETDGSAAEQYDIIGDGNAYYNQSLNNQAVVDRWSNRIHNSTIYNNGEIYGDFEASLSVDTAMPMPAGPFFADYDNVISDPGGDYLPATGNGTYVLPNTGVYLFRVTIDLRVVWSGVSPTQVEYALLIINTTTSDNDFRTKVIGNPNDTAVGLDDVITTVDYRDTFTLAIQGNAGDNVTILAPFSFLPTPAATILQTTKWEASNAIFGDSVSVVRRATFDLCDSEFLQLRDNVRNPINVSNVAAWPRTFTYRPFGLSEIEVEYIRNS